MKLVSLLASILLVINNCLSSPVHHSLQITCHENPILRAKVYIYRDEEEVTFEWTNQEGFIKIDKPKLHDMNSLKVRIRHNCVIPNMANCNLPYSDHKIPFTTFFNPASHKHFLRLTDEKYEEFRHEKCY